MRQKCKISIGNRCLTVDALTSDASRAKGYQNQKAAPGQNDGLLFVFYNEAPRRFHMKNVAFDLTLLGFDKSGKLICIIPMASNSRKQYKTPPCKFVVEVASGWGFGLRIGTKLRFGE